MANLNPKRDGETHINMYSQAETELGKMLSNFYGSSFEVPQDGTFSSVEGYYYWLLSPKDSDREVLRNLSGYKAKEVGKKLRRAGYKVIREQESFRRKILRAIYSKIRSNPRIERKLVNSTLPLKHYYVYGGDLVEADGTQWLVDGTEKIRKGLKKKIKIREKEGDLFDVNFDKFVLAHCVSSDGKMGKGIAKQFVDKFPGIKESVKNSGIGEAVSYETKDLKVYNLVTKQKYFHKPNYKDIKKSLIDLKEKMVKNNEEYLAIPRIASGLDGKNWDKIWRILGDVFQDTDIKVKVKYLKES